MKRRRLAVRPWTPADSAMVEEWWDECWIDAGVEKRDIPRPAAEVAVAGCRGDVMLITLDDMPSGLLVTSDTAGICLIALARGLRGWGYGSEAVAVTEAAPLSRPLALASPQVGLSLYFWLRLGYAPSPDQPYAPAVLLLEKITG